MQRIYIVVLHYSSLPPSDRRFTTQFSHPLNNFFHHICQHTTMIKGKSTRFNDVDWASLKPSRKSLIKLFRNVKCSYTFEGGPNGVIFTLTYRRGTQQITTGTGMMGGRKVSPSLVRLLGKWKFSITRNFIVRKAFYQTTHHITFRSQSTFFRRKLFLPLLVINLWIIISNSISPSST